MMSSDSDVTQPIGGKKTVAVAFGRSSRPPPQKQRTSPLIWLALSWNLLLTVYVIASVISGDLP